MALDPLLKEFNERLQRAETDRSRVSGRFDDILRHVFPTQHRFGTTTLPSPSTVDELYDSTAITCVSDFASDLQFALTPPFTKEWIRVETARGLGKLDPAQERAVKAWIGEWVETVYTAMVDAGLFEATRDAYQQLAMGTGCVMITDPGAPLSLMATPVHVADLYLDRGPEGSVDGIFRKRTIRAELIPCTWEGASIPSKFLQSPDREVEVKEGTWRDRKRKDAIVWRTVVVCEGEVLLDAETTGDGACPFIVARWSTDPTSAWGFGPLWHVLPTIKTVNDATALMLKAAEFAAFPVHTYDNDGVIDVSGGVEPGIFIPKALGSEIKPLQHGGRLDAGYFQIDKDQAAIKRALFQNYPEQRGLTPPTATQWLDQARELSRRMGAPAASLIVNWQFAIIKRFAWLLEKRGALPKVEIGPAGQIQLRPTSPLVQSQDQETRERMRMLAAEVMQIFGQQGVLVLDPIAYAQEAVKLEGGGLAGMKFVRKKEEIEQAVRNAAALAQQAGAIPGGAQ